MNNNNGLVFHHEIIHIYSVLSLNRGAESGVGAPGVLILAQGWSPIFENPGVGVPQKWKLRIPAFKFICCTKFDYLQQQSSYRRFRMAI